MAGPLWGGGGGGGGAPGVPPPPPHLICYAIITVETVALGLNFFFSTSMFGIGCWRNGK